MLYFLRKRGAVCPETWGRADEMFPKSKRLEFPLPSCHRPCVHLDVSTDLPQRKKLPKSPFFFNYCLVETVVSYLSKNLFHTKLYTQMPNLSFEFFLGPLKTH